LLPRRQWRNKVAGAAKVKSSEPIPRSWTLIALVVAVVVVDVATQGKLGFSAGLVGLVAAVVIGLIIRQLYFRTRQ